MDIKCASKLRQTQSGKKRTAPQQPTTILQLLPATMMPPGAAPSIRPCGHVKEDLVEMMMIQNAQMHQVILNNMTMSALGSFGDSGPPPLPVATESVAIIHEEEEDPGVYHHYYQAATYLSYPAWFPPPLPQPTLGYQDPAEALEPASLLSHRDRLAVPPPPPPGATRAAGADIPPAAGGFDTSA
ncbi:proline-rich protein 29-like [Myripristis murdjan]|uniref:proline-rich protein 29-like n=1 Tax=Myripristis murdjan TaxID=586833 RepID=UPI00117603D3|nr:proline-rich protein 29-like [Myripristis murdjan]